MHTEYGVRNALNVYGINTSMTGGAPLDYHGVINNIKENDNVLITEANSNRYLLLGRNLIIQIIMN